MDLRLPIRPDGGSRYGFENAPVSKLLLLASGAATFNFLFLPGKYHGFVDLHWPLVISRKEVWRLLTSQVVYDSTIELLYGTALLYHFRVLERQWGSKKFASFLLAACTLTLGSHLICCNSKLIKLYFPVTETLAGGLYGPIFALLVFYIKDVYSGSLLANNGFVLSDKWLAYLIALRMLFSNDKSFVAGILGLLSGLVYSGNFLYVKRWLRVPDTVSSFVCSVYNWFRIEDDSKPKYRKSFAGATEDIHDDLIYDYMLKVQMNRRSANGHPRQQMAQGYANTLQPAVDPVQAFFDSTDEQNRPQDHDWHTIPDPNQTGNSESTQNPDQEPLPDDKIQRLVEMGFNREAVMGALEDTGHNIQEATNVLLSQ